MELIVVVLASTLWFIVGAAFGWGKGKEVGIIEGMRRCSYRTGIVEKREAR